MYIVIYNKITKRIIRVIPKELIDKGVTYGFSDNCAEMIVDTKPEGMFVK